MSAIASQLSGISAVCSAVCSGAHQRKHQSSASPAFVREIHRSPVDSPTKRASNVKNISIWWRHPDVKPTWHQMIIHYGDVIMDPRAFQITSVSIACWTVGSGVDQRKHQSSASLAFVQGIHRWPVNSPHKRPVTRKMFPFDDVIM